MDEKPREKPAKPQRRRGLKEVRDARDTAVKASIRLGPAQYQRLALASVMTGRDKSAIVNDLIDAHLPNYVVSERGPAGGKADAA